MISFLSFQILIVYVIKLWLVGQYVKQNGSYIVCLLGCYSLLMSGMEKRRIDDCEPGPVPSPRPVDRFGFVKQEHGSPHEGVIKSRSAIQFERYTSSLVISSEFVLGWDDRELTAIFVSSLLII